MSFGRLRQRILLKCVPHVQHDYFSSFNQSEHCFLASSLPLQLKLSTIYRTNVRFPKSRSSRKNRFFFSCEVECVKVLAPGKWPRLESPCCGLIREFKINDATAATTPQNLTKTKVLHALHVHFLIPCISFEFSTNLRREMTISQVLQRT